MKIAVVSCGTRGDVQPMAALTLGLNAAGHQALLHAPPENEAWVWRSQVTKLGLGPRAGLLRMLSARSLSKAVLECLGNERYRRKAEEIATAIQGTDGVDLTVRAVEAIKM